MINQLVTCPSIHGGGGDGDRTTSLLHMHTYPKYKGKTECAFLEVLEYNECEAGHDISCIMKYHDDVQFFQPLYKHHIYNKYQQVC